MKTIKGDLIKMAFEGDFDVIVHGCNCQVQMGSGIAKQIRAECEEAWMADVAADTRFRSKSDKLGSYSAATIFRKDGTYFIVVNAYTQLYPGKGTLSYEAIGSCFEKIKANFPDKRIGYPMIGAGLAGGDWKRISAIIDYQLEGLDHTFVEFQP